VAPADVGLGRLVGGRPAARASFSSILVEPRTQHVPGLRLVLVLRASGLTHTTATPVGMWRQPHRGLSVLLTCLAPGAGPKRMVSTRTSDLGDIYLDAVVDDRKNWRRLRMKCAGGALEIERAINPAPADVRRPSVFSQP